MFKPNDEFMAAYERAEENELCHASKEDDEEAARKRRRRTALAVGGGVAAGAAITAAVMNRRSGGAAPAAVKTPLDVAFEESRADKVDVKGRTIKRGGKSGVTYKNARAEYAPGESGHTPRVGIEQYNAAVGGLKSGKHYKNKSTAPRPESVEPSRKVAKEFEKRSSTRRLRKRMN